MAVPADTREGPLFAVRSRQRRRDLDGERVLRCLYLRLTGATAVVLGAVPDSQAARKLTPPLAQLQLDSSLAIVRTQG
jgi:hypothetical protein